MISGIIDFISNDMTPTSWVIAGITGGLFSAVLIIIEICRNHEKKAINNIFEGKNAKGTVDAATNAPPRKKKIAPSKCLSAIMAVVFLFYAISCFVFAARTKQRPFLIPDVCGKNHETATAELENLGFTVHVQKNESNDKNLLNRVYHQSPLPGHWAMPGDSIVLTVIANLNVDVSPAPTGGATEGGDLGTQNELPLDMQLNEIEYRGICWGVKNLSDLRALKFENEEISYPITFNAKIMEVKSYASVSMSGDIYDIRYYICNGFDSYGNDIGRWFIYDYREGVDSMVFEDTKVKLVPGDEIKVYGKYYASNLGSDSKPLRHFSLYYLDIISNGKDFISSLYKAYDIDLNQTNYVEGNLGSIYISPYFNQYFPMATILGWEYDYDAGEYDLSKPLFETNFVLVVCIVNNGNEDISIDDLVFDVQQGNRKLNMTGSYYRQGCENPDDSSNRIISSRSGAVFSLYFSGLKNENSSVEVTISSRQNGVNSVVLLEADVYDPERSDGNEGWIFDAPSSNS